jgi:hypothetical protein
MALPVLTHPTFEVQNPANDETLKFRPMLVKEEKLLLMAKQSENRNDQLTAIQDILQACLMTDSVKISEQPFFALEYLFIQLRAQSISNKAKASYQDADEDKPRTFDVDLSKVKLKKSSEINPMIDLGNNITLVLKYPPVSMYTSKEFYELDDAEVFDHILLNSMDKIFENDTMHDCKTISKKELKDFIDSIPSKDYEKIQAFFENIPTLLYVIEYKNEAGVERRIELSSIDDFFTFV